jgi:CspA family cold shock protein
MAAALNNGDAHPAINRVCGTVKFFNTLRGYGFIVPDNGGPDVFVHHSNIDMPGYRDLEAEDRVTYIPIAANRGPAAAMVRKVS